MSEFLSKPNRSMVEQLLAEPEIRYTDSRLPDRIGVAMAIGEAAGALFQIVEIPARGIIATRHLVGLHPPESESRTQAAFSELMCIPSIANERIEKFGRTAAKFMNRTSVKQ